MDPVDGAGTETTGSGADEAVTQADVEEAFGGVLFGILDAVVLGPMRSENIQIEDDGDDSGKVYR